MGYHGLYRKRAVAWPFVGRHVNLGAKRDKTKTKAHLGRKTQMHVLGLHHMMEKLFAP